MKKMILAALLSVLTLNVSAVTGGEANDQKGGSGCAPQVQASALMVFWGNMKNTLGVLTSPNIFEFSTDMQPLQPTIEKCVFGPDVHKEVEEMLRF